MKYYDITITSREREEILSAINKSFLIDDCLANNKLRVTVNARHAIAHYLHRKERLTLSEAGRMINKDHATIIHSCNVHDALYQYDKAYREKYDNFIIEMKPIKDKRWLCVETQFNLQIIKRQ